MIQAIKCLFGFHRWVQPRTLFRHCPACGLKQDGTPLGWQDTQ